MGGSRTQLNKTHKSRFSSKSSRNLHKTFLKDKSRIAKSDRNSLKGAKASRLQRSKILRDQKKAAVLKEKRALNPYSRPPRVIVLFGLTASVDLDSLSEELFTTLSGDNGNGFSQTVYSSEYKLKLTIIKAPYGDLLTCMEMAKVADLIVFVASVSCVELFSTQMDPFAAQCLSVFRSLGMPNTAVFLRDLPNDMKKRNEAKKFCCANLSGEFPEDCKFFFSDSQEDLQRFLNIYKEQRITLPHWRSQRSYIMTYKAEIIEDNESGGMCTLALTGFVRGRPLSVNKPIHISGAGDFQLAKADVLKDPFSAHSRKDSSAMDADDTSVEEVARTVHPDPLSQEPLIVENDPDPHAGEQTWPTEAEMAEAYANMSKKRHKKKMVPQGTSEYQAAWILDDTDEEASDGESDVNDSMILDESEPLEHATNFPDFEEDSASLHLRDSDEETDRDSMMLESEIMTREQMEDEIKRIKEAHADDEEFPDEVDTPLDIAARKRFAKYRGLKSFRTSSWDPKESLPPEYGRVFAFDNFARTQKHVLAKDSKEDDENKNESISVGQYAKIYVRNVPCLTASLLCSQARTRPVIACGLLPNETKMSVLHFSVKKCDSYEAPIKSKEELIFHVGFRQFVSRPLFSSDNINSDKHKMERFLHAGRFAVASIFAPICFLPQPLIALKEESGGSVSVAAVGSLKTINPDRIILKKIILSGYPHRVSKQKVIVRYMFHNPDDIKWFKPVELWTKCGRRGRIKEPVGTHGIMKCLFNGVVQQHDTVCMSLYKRAYPKWSDRRFPLQETTA